MDIFAYLLLFFLPFERIPSLQFHGVTVRISVILLIVAFFTVLPWLYVRRRLGPRSLLDTAIMVFAAIAILSSVFASEHSRSLEVVVFLASTILGYVVISRLLRGMFPIIKVLQTVVASGTITSLFGLYQFVGNSEGLAMKWTGLSTQYSKVVFSFPRVQSVGLEPLYFGNFLFFPILMLGTFLLTLERKPRWYELLSLLIMLVAFCLTLSRGAYSGILGGTVLLIVIFMALRQIPRNLLLVGGVAIASILISLGAIQAVSGSKGVQTFSHQATVTDTKTTSASVTPRLANFKEAWRLFKTKPVLGIGIGNYGIENTVSPHVPGGAYMIVNDQYLETLAETGILGFLALVGIIVTAFLSLKNAMLPTKDRWITYALAATFLGILIQYTTMSTIYLLYLWTVLALIEACSYQKPGSHPGSPAME